MATGDNVVITNGNMVKVTVSDTGLKGRPGVVYRGDWTTTNKYYVGDVVNYLGSTWICSAFLDASTTAFPHITTANWSLFSEKGDKGDSIIEVSATAPVGTCSVSSYTDQATCETAGHLWTDPQVGDMWFDLSIGRLYSRVKDAQDDEVWFDISGVVGSMDAQDIVVSANGELPAGSLQDVLQHLEDQIFHSATTPTGSNIEEGDLWYDQTDNQLKFYRNGVWEIVVQTSAISDANGYDDITMNGGYF